MAKIKCRTGNQKRICERLGCGNVFYAWPYQKTRHCSMRCAALSDDNIRRIASIGKAHVGEKNHNWKGGKEKWEKNRCQKKCLDCGKRISTYRCLRCRKCFGLSKRKTSSIKQIQELRERTRFRDSIQKLVFERDNYTCQICGTKGGDLQVDHIQSWAEYVELRFDMNNCRTLCAGCHYKITFGKDMPSKTRAWGHHFFEGRLN